ncbi:alpha/beta hydrolase [Staphylococcus argenteus]|uniref:alpha/beta hydrolase n=1 Tax=Staphylococcus argenteus TaxID=985002 RepID=UPI000977CEB7|nr:alpha/beta hydrolase [Staphylococcus argenteus]OMH96934.1 alpha/beta hydrolase [Staphylococcus argenteus]
MTEIKDKVTTTDAFTLPHTIIKAKKQPTKGAIVYIHGGGLMFGNSNDLSQQYIDILTEQYDLVQLSYRLSPEVSLDCIIDDIFTSFDDIKLLYPNTPIFTFGRSSGAYLSLLIARNRDIDGVIDFYGYSRIDTEPFKIQNDYYAKIARSVNESMVKQLTSPTPIIQDQIAQRFLIYVYARGTGEWMNMINVTDYTDSKYNIASHELKTLPPVFIAHCIGDYDVPIEESEHIMNHVPNTTFERLSKNEHDFDRRPNDEAITVYHKVVAFLNTIITK